MATPSPAVTSVEHRSLARRAWAGVGSIPPRPVLWVLLGSYLLARVSIFLRFRVFTSYDTGSYAPRPGAPVQVSTLSFSGHAPRPWGVPLFYSLVSTDYARAVLQLLLGTAAWVLVGYALWLYVRSVVARIVGVALVVALALTPPVYIWDYAILSESLSVNFGLLAMALFAIWAKTGSRTGFVGLVLAGSWWAVTRQDVLPLVGVLVATLGWYAWRHRERRLAAGVAAAALVASMGAQAAILATIDTSYQSWGMGFRLSEATFLYRLRFQVLPDAQVTAYYREHLGMPSCPDAERVAQGKPWMMPEFFAAYRACPALMAWERDNATSSEYRYAWGQPVHFARTVLDTMPQTLGGDVRGYSRPVRLMPHQVTRAFFPPRAWVLPVLLGVLGLAILGCGYLGAFRRRRALAVAGTGLALASLANVVLTLMYAAGEYARFGIQEAVLLRLAVVVVLVAAVDAAVTKRQETSPAGSDT